MALNLKGSEASNLNVPKKSQKVLSLSENVKVLSVRKKKKYAEISKIYDKNKYEILKKEINSC